MKYKYISNDYNMSIRPNPTTSNGAIGTLSRGTEGRGDDLTLYPNGDKWIKILEGGSAVGWVAVVHLGKVYGVLTEIGVEPPPPAPVEEFPQSFTLTNDSTGNKAQYVFVKVISEIENTIRVSG